MPAAKLRAFVDFVMTVVGPKGARGAKRERRRGAAAWCGLTRFVTSIALSVTSCHARSAAVPATPSVPAVASAVAAVSSAPAVLLSRADVPDPSLGRFRVRLRLGDPVPYCFPQITGLAAVSNGEVWVVGACGLRARLTATGFVDLTAATRHIHQNVGPLNWDCDGVGDYGAVAANSANDVYFSGATKCGLDPNGIFARPIERFDGHAFRDLRTTAAFGDARERSPDVLAVGAGHTYALALGDDWTGSPRCAVYELHGARIALIRSCPEPLRHPIATEEWTDLGVDAEGGLWVSARRTPPNEGESTPFLLHWRDTRWTEEGPADSGILTRGADGTLWLFGSQAWSLAPGDKAWESRPLAVPKDAKGFAVVGPKDIWIAGETGMLHYDGLTLTRVPSEVVHGNETVSLVSAGGGRVWASDGLRVWQLMSDAEPPPTVWDKP